MKIQRTHFGSNRIKSFGIFALTSVTIKFLVVPPARRFSNSTIAFFSSSESWKNKENELAWVIPISDDSSLKVNEWTHLLLSFHIISCIFLGRYHWFRRETEPIDDEHLNEYSGRWQIIPSKSTWKMTTFDVPTVWLYYSLSKQDSQNSSLECKGSDFVNPHFHQSWRQKYGLLRMINQSIDQPNYWLMDQAPNQSITETLNRLHWQEKPSRKILKNKFRNLPNNDGSAAANRTTSFQHCQ